MVNYNTMTATWQTLLRLTEAPGEIPAKERLINYIRHSYGDHAADVAKTEVEKHWNPEGLSQLRQKLSKFGDKRILKILDKAAEEVPRRSGGSRMDRIAGLASGDYVNPADIAAKDATVAATAGMRPDRAGTQPTLPASKPTMAVPGVRPTHDVGQSVRGTAQNHTRPPQRQVSQQGDKDRTVSQQMDFLQGLLAKDPDHPQAEKIQAALDKLSERDPEELLKGPEPRPTTVGTDLETTRASLEKMKRRYQELQGVGEDPGLIKKLSKQAVVMKNAAANNRDPEERARLVARSRELAQKVNQMRAEVGEIPGKMQDMERSLSRMTQTGVAGMAAAQKKVDSVYKSGYAKVAAKMARQLGVPPTELRMSVKKDPETGKEKTTFNIWSAEKITRWKNAGPDLPGGPPEKPAVYDKPTGLAGYKSDPKNQKHFDPEAPSGPWTGQHTDKAPEAGDDRQAIGTEPLQKPMMKAPKGLSPEEMRHLAKLRKDYAQLKNSGAGEEELQLAREPIEAIMASGGEVVQVIRPGLFDGEVWRPHGISRDVKTSRPDKATGQMTQGMRTTDPAQEREPLVWDEKSNDWVRRSQRVTKNAERNVDQGPEGSRRPWMSGAQSVKGTPVSTSADQQKVQQAAQAKSAPSSSGPTTVQKHRDIKNAVQQAFTAKKDVEEPDESPADVD